MVAAEAVGGGAAYRLEEYGEVVLLARGTLVTTWVGGVLSALTGGMKGPAVVVLIVFLSGGAHCSDNQSVVN